MLLDVPVCLRGLNFILWLEPKGSQLLEVRFTSDSINQHVCSGHTQFIPTSNVFEFPMVACFLTAGDGEQRLWVRGWGYGLIWKKIRYDNYQIKSQTNMVVCVAVVIYITLLLASKDCGFTVQVKQTVKDLLWFGQVSFIMKFRSREQNLKWPQTNNCCHLRFSYRTPNWVLPSLAVSHIRSCLIHKIKSATN